jgi:hypothetical protein
MINRVLNFIDAGNPNLVPMRLQHAQQRYILVKVR